MSEIRIVHEYPAAANLTQAMGGHGLSVLHALLQHAHLDNGDLIVSISLRQLRIDVAASKDTISRRLNQLEHLGVVKRIRPDDGPFVATTYRLHLEGHGIELVA